MDSSEVRMVSSEGIGGPRESWRLDVGDPGRPLAGCPWRAARRTGHECHATV